MNPNEINVFLSRGEIHQKGLFPHLDQLKNAPFHFEMDFGLSELPMEPGILLIRGPRQYGKSTWLESQLYKSIKSFGPGTAYYLNGENIADTHQLEQEIELVTHSFHKNAHVKRIFIDEITAIQKWEMALKKLADRGDISDILIITTGSKATDLRRGSEKLPGRKGHLSRSTYLFTPVSYKEFYKKCKNHLKSNSVITYLLSGGSPIACTELVTTGKIPEYVIELTRDWIEGEVALSGRSRAALMNIFNTLFRFGGTPVGQLKLARESGLANNTVAAGYIELLNDLNCVVPCYPWDVDREILILRKPCKYHFTNLLAVNAYHPNRLRSPDDFTLLTEQEQGMWYEWLIAQELMRRNAIAGKDILAPLAFWQDKNNEIDFVDTPDEWIEVKRGRCSPHEFAWFAKKFPRKKLLVINSEKFATHHVNGVLLEDFLFGKKFNSVWK